MSVVTSITRSRRPMAATARPARTAAAVLLGVAVSVTLVSALADPGHGSRSMLLMSLLVIRTGTDVTALGTIGALVLLLCRPSWVRPAAGTDLARTDLPRTDLPRTDLLRSAAAWAGAWTVLLATALVTELLVPSVVVAHGGLGPDVADAATRMRWMVAGVVVAGVVRVLAGAARSDRDGVVVLGVAMLGLVPATMTGHGSVTTEGWTATIGLLLHVAAVSVWVGGLLAVLVHARSLWAQGIAVETVRRFSRVALVGFAGVAASGVVTALAQTDLDQLLASRAHGAILGTKVALLVVVGAAGAAQRYVVLPRLPERGPVVFLVLAASELVLLAAALGLAVTLTHTAS
jgi:putative copper resistance protein D